MRASTSVRRGLAVLAVAPLALGLVACGGDAADDDLDRPVATETITQTPDAGSASPDAPSSSAGGAAPADGALEAAAETALAEVSGATLVSIDVDDNGDWDVTLLADDGTESDVDVSADGSTVTRGPVSDNDDNDADDVAERQRLLEAQVDYLAAIETAQGEITDLQVTGASLDEDNGTLRWDIDFGDGTNDDAQTVLVDAASGDVVGTETDTDDDNDD